MNDEMSKWLKDPRASLFRILSKNTNAPKGCVIVCEGKTDVSFYKSKITSENWQFTSPYQGVNEIGENKHEVIRIKELFQSIFLDVKNIFFIVDKDYTNDISQPKKNLFITQYYSFENFKFNSRYFLNHKLYKMFEKNFVNDKKGLQKSHTKSFKNFVEKNKKYALLEENSIDDFASFLKNFKGKDLGRFFNKFYFKKSLKLDAKIGFEDINVLIEIQENMK